MGEMGFLSVQDAARKLGLSEQRVRVLVASHRIPAAKVGGRWLLPASALQERSVLDRFPGRPLSPANAWAYLWLLSGRNPEWLDPSQRSHLKYRRYVDPEELIARVRSRCRVESYWVHSGMLSKLRDDLRLVLSGVSAARKYSIDLLAEQEVEGYVRASELEALIDDVKAIDGERPNCLLRIVEEESWPFDNEERVAPALVAAIDLMESSNPRARRAGAALISSLLGGSV